MRRISSRAMLVLSGMLLVTLIATVSPSPARMALKITIDWQPSPEYYGFFYALDAGFYREAGFDVEIVPGSGAPQAAAAIAAGQFLMGTTTSDNILRMVGRTAEFSRAVPIFRFNPSVVVSLAPSSIRHVHDLKGKRLGTNPAASYYTQLLYLLKTPTITAAGVVEDATIGFGGIRQLRERTIDAMLAYTTNAVADLEAEGIQVNEVFLGDEGAESYGLVLAVASPKALREGGLREADVDRLVGATLRGYRTGGEDIHRSVSLLVKRDFTIGARKADLAIRKIARLNNRAAYSPERLDRWVEGPGITEEVRAKVLKLYR